MLEGGTGAGRGLVVHMFVAHFRLRENINYQNFVAQAVARRGMKKLKEAR